MRFRGRAESAGARWWAWTSVIPICVPALAVAVVGCGSGNGTSSTQTASTVPPPAPANASPDLTRAGYAALRDTVAMGTARNVSSASPSAVAAAISNVRKTCPHLGNDQANSQVRAMRAECEAGAQEASAYVALGTCPRAAALPQRRACFVETTVRPQAMNTAPRPALARATSSCDPG